MSLLTLKIGAANRELKNVTQMVSDRHDQVQELKAAIKEKSKATVEESIEYKRVVENNKKLVSQLEQLKKDGARIAEASKKADEEMRSEKDRKLQACGEENEVMRALKDFEEMPELMKPDTVDFKRTEELRKQQDIYAGTLNSLLQNNELLRQRVKEKESYVNVFEYETQTIDAHNKELINKISVFAHNYMTGTSKVHPSHWS